MLEKSRIAGAALETVEIRDVVQVVDRAAEWRQVSLSPPATMKLAWNAVALLSGSIVDFRDFLRSFRNKILPDGTLEDRASPELARIRREIEKQRRLIQESLRGYLRRLAEGGGVQEELITIRGERFVIPVKVEQKRRVQGVVHGASSSGQTVFVEPLETIEQNNEMVRLLDEEQAEIHRILLEMTARIGEHAEEIVAAVEVLAELELQFAKARFAEEYNCVEVRLRSPEETVLVLANARHPLLERNLKAKNQPIVPVTIELEGERRQLIITGPNTGGKTVGLKTTGLLALMAQSGVPVPADRADLPVFDAVLADIGDYQSIAQNLSTFSAHVTNIDFISRTATAQSLVLLDELGSATDPEEGAALAVAIAEHFRRVGSCHPHFDASHFAQSVRGEHSRSGECLGRLRSIHLAAYLRTAGGRPGRIRRDQHRAPTGAESCDYRVGAIAAGHPGAGRRPISGSAACRAGRGGGGKAPAAPAGTGIGAGEGPAGLRGKEGTAGKNQRNGEKARRASCGTSNIGRARRSRPSRIERRRRSFQKTPSAASPNCGVNFASSLIRPWWRTRAAPTKGIRTPSRRW